jgi:hypothetical protein
MAPASAVVHPSGDQSRRESAADRIWTPNSRPPPFGRRLAARGSRCRGVSHVSDRHAGCSVGHWLPITGRRRRKRSRKTATRRAAAQPQRRRPNVDLVSSIASRRRLDGPPLDRRRRPETSVRRSACRAERDGDRWRASTALHAGSRPAPTTRRPREARLSAHRPAPSRQP